MPIPTVVPSMGWMILAGLTVIVIVVGFVLIAVKLYRTFKEPT